MWYMYGWFTGLMCCGSCFGAVAWGLYLRYIEEYFTIGRFTSQPANSSIPISLSNLQLQSSSAIWYAAFLVPYAIEFLALSTAKMFVLFRMIHLSMPDGEVVPWLWSRAAWTVTTVVVLICVVGLGSSVAAAVHSKRTSDSYGAAAAASTANNTDAFNRFANEAFGESATSYKFSGVQQFCEVSVLMLIILAFLFAGSAFAQYASARLRDLALAAAGDSSAIRKVDEFAGSGFRTKAETMKAAGATAVRGGRTLRQVACTAVFVFVTFLLRAVFATMNAVSDALQDEQIDCTHSNSPCDPVCFNVFASMQTWITLTPEFRIVVVLISSPLALLVSLWGMTTDDMSKLLRAGRNKNSSHKQTLLSFGPPSP